MSLYNPVVIDSSQTPITLKPIFVPESNEMTVRFDYCEADGNDSAGYYLIFDNVDPGFMREYTIAALNSQGQVDYPRYVYCRKADETGEFITNHLFGTLKYSTVNDEYTLIGQDTNYPEAVKGRYTIRQNAQGGLMFKVPIYDLLVKSADVVAGFNGTLISDTVTSNAELEVFCITMERQYEGYGPLDPANNSYMRPLYVSNGYFAVTENALDDWYRYSPVNSMQQEVAYTLGFNRGYIMRRAYNYENYHYIKHVLEEAGIFDSGAQNAVTSMNIDSAHTSNLSLFYNDDYTGNKTAYSSECTVTDPTKLSIMINHTEQPETWSFWSGPAKLTLTVDGKEYTVWIYCDSSAV